MRAAATPSTLSTSSWTTRPPRRFRTTTPIVDGSYQPANYEPGDPFPAPALPERKRPAVDLRRDEPKRDLEPLHRRRRLVRSGRHDGLAARHLDERWAASTSSSTSAAPASAAATSSSSSSSSATATATPCRSVRGAEGDRLDHSQGPHADPCEALLCRSHPPCSLEASWPRDRSEPEAGQEARTRQQGEPGARPQISIAVSVPRGVRV